MATTLTRYRIKRDGKPWTAGFRAIPLGSHALAPRLLLNQLGLDEIEGTHGFPGVTQRREPVEA